MSILVRCSHGYGGAAPCGDAAWCGEEADHAGPHDRQRRRCRCTHGHHSWYVPAATAGDYEAARAAYVETGDPGDLAEMLELVTSD